MPNADIAALIGRQLGEGLPHPGNPANRQEPHVLPLVAFRTAGMDGERVKGIRNAAQAIGEAVVNLIETTGESVIIRRDELDTLRSADAGPGAPMEILCSACKHPILWVKVTNGRAVVTPALLDNANTSCPHRVDNMEATP